MRLDGRNSSATSYTKSVREDLSSSGCAHPGESKADVQRVEDEQRPVIPHQIVLDLAMICIHRIYLHKVSRTYVAKKVSVRDTDLDHTTHRRGEERLKTLACADHWRPAPGIT